MFRQADKRLCLGRAHRQKPAVTTTYTIMYTRAASVWMDTIPSTKRPRATCWIAQTLSMIFHGATRCWRSSVQKETRAFTSAWKCVAGAKQDGSVASLHDTDALLCRVFLRLGARSAPARLDTSRWIIQHVGRVPLTAYAPVAHILRCCALLSANWHVAISKNTAPVRQVEY